MHLYAKLCMDIHILFSWANSGMTGLYGSGCLPFKETAAQFVQFYIATAVYETVSLYFGQTSCSYSFKLMQFLKECNGI